MTNLSEREFPGCYVLLVGQVDGKNYRVDHMSFYFSEPSLRDVEYLRKKLETDKALGMTDRIGGCGIRHGWMDKNGQIKGDWPDANIAGSKTYHYAEPDVVDKQKGIIMHGMSAETTTPCGDM